MNVENIKKLRDFIADEKHPWNIQWPAHCFVGQIHRLTGRPFLIAEFMGLGDPYSKEVDQMVEEIIMPEGFNKENSGYTREKAVEMLDHLMATGEIRWNV